MNAVFAAILFLAPHVPKDDAKRYAELIVEHARAKRLDPLLVVAIAHHESRFTPDRSSRTSDYGLMQVHVTRRLHGQFRGREQELYKPDVNIRLGVDMAAFWKRWHKRRCAGEHHHWWGHYKWGRVVKTSSYGERVRDIYQRLNTRAGVM